MRRIVVLSFLGTRKCALNAMRRPVAREEGRAAPSVRRAVAPPLAEPRHAIAIGVATDVCWRGAAGGAAVLTRRCVAAVARSTPCVE